MFSHLGLHLMGPISLVVQSALVQYPSAWPQYLDTHIWHEFALSTKYDKL